MKVTTDNLSMNAMGGTEIMKYGLAQRLDPDLYDKFQIICSRVRDVDPNKIPILWLHDLPNDPESSRLADKNFVDQFAKLVFVSHWQMNEYIHAFGLPWDKCAVMQNAIEPFDFRDYNTEKIKLIYHSTPHRGLEILYPVFDHLSKIHDNIELDVYSSFALYGWKDRDLPYQELFQKLEDHPNINYHGSVENSVIRQALSEAHIFAYPNIWPETSCLCLIEALAAGCVAVMPNYAALPETGANWTTMYQWTQNPQKHANTFAANLNSVINTYNDNLNGLVPKLASQQQYFNNFYSWELRTMEWTNLLQGILHERK